MQNCYKFIPFLIGLFHDTCAIVYIIISSLFGRLITYSRLFTSLCPFLAFVLHTGSYLWSLSFKLVFSYYTYIYFVKSYLFSLHMLFMHKFLPFLLLIRCAIFIYLCVITCSKNMSYSVCVFAVLFTFHKYKMFSANWLIVFYQ